MNVKLLFEDALAQPMSGAGCQNAGFLSPREMKPVWARIPDDACRSGNPARTLRRVDERRRDSGEMSNYQHMNDV